MALVLVTWLARKSHTNCPKFRSKLSHFLTYLGFFGLKLISVMSGVDCSKFWSSKWPLSGLFSRSKAGNHSRLLFFFSEKLRFFFFFLQDLLTLLTIKSALSEFELKALLNYLLKIIFIFLGSEYLNLVANFESFEFFLFFVQPRVRISKY